MAQRENRAASPIAHDARLQPSESHGYNFNNDNHNNNKYKYSNGDDDMEEEELVVQSLENDDISEEEYPSFQLPSSMFRPLYRTDSILKKNRVLDKARRGSSPTMQQVSGEELDEHNHTNTPSTESSKDTNAKRVKFASHVQVQQTSTQYQRNRIPAPYDINFWRRNRIMHVLCFIVAIAIFIVEVILLGAFWYQSCSQPIQFIFLGDVVATGILVCCVIAYVIMRLVTHIRDEKRKKTVKRKTLSQLRRLKRERERKYGFEGTPNSPMHTKTLSSRTTSNTHMNYTEPSNVSTLEEHHIQLNTSFQKAAMSPTSNGTLFDGVRRVESEGDLSDDDFSDHVATISTYSDRKESDPSLVSSLKTKVVEASIQDDDTTPSNNKHNSQTRHTRGSQSDSDKSTSPHSTNSTEHGTSSSSNVSSTSNKAPPPSTQHQASISTIPPVRRKFRGKRLRTRKFRDSIVINKRNFRQHNHKPGDFELDPPPMLSSPEMQQVQISENPTQDYKILSRSIREVEEGRLMLEPLSGYNSTTQYASESIQQAIYQVIRRRFFSLTFLLFWIIPHLWAIVSLVFIIMYGNCPLRSALYYLNALYFGAIASLSAIEFCIIVMSYK